MGGRGLAGDRAGGRDRGYRRRCRPLVHPAVPVPLVPDRQREVRPHPVQSAGRLPATGAFVIAAPLPIVTGSGSAGRCSRWSNGDERRRGGRRDPRHLRCRPGVRRRRVGQLPRHQRDDRAGRPFVAARHEGGAATMADAYSRMRGLRGRAVRPPGMRAHHRGDGDHRSGQEPHPDARARRRGHPAALELLRRPGRAGPRRGCRVDAGDLREAAVAEATGGGLARPPRAAARPVEPAAAMCSRSRGLRRPAPVLPQPTSQRVQAGARRPSRLVEALGRSRRPVFVAGPGPRARRAPWSARRAVRRAAGHVRGGQGLFAATHGRSTSPVGSPRRSRPSDPGRRPHRRLGVRAEHVDHAPRTSHRPGRDRGAGRRHARGSRRAPDVDLGVVGDVAATAEGAALAGCGPATRALPQRRRPRAHRQGDALARRGLPGRRHRRARRPPDA